jgi:hypothetical protein
MTSETSGVLGFCALIRNLADVRNACGMTGGTMELWLLCESARLTACRMRWLIKYLQNTNKS